MKCIAERRALWRERKAQWRRNHPEHRQKQAEYYREWYRTNGRARAPDYAVIIRIWDKDNPEKVKARQILRYAVKRGVIDRASRCASCGREVKASGHHQDYSNPFEVMWLCASCHKKIHLGLIDIPT